MLNDIIIRLKMVGQFEKPIFIHKFRSMYPNAHEDYLNIVRENGIDNIGKPANDPRVTCWGKFMRKYFIDEIPQIYDLVIGTLSFVGIRPRSKEDWKNYSEKHKERALNHKPGLIGIHYYHLNSRNFGDIIESEKEYLDRIEKDGKEKTDYRYFNQIFENIILRGLRSR